MADIYEIRAKCLDEADFVQKCVFFQALLHLSAVDGKVDEAETEYIKNIAQSQGIDNVEALRDYKNEDDLLKRLKIINNKQLAIELIYEMCELSHVDNVLSDEETLFIGKVGLALGLNIEKIEQISNLVVERLIWLEQARLVFEEK